MRKTKIICTLGPASSSEEQLRDMMIAGMNVARFNFSHGTHESHLALFEKIKKVREELGLPVATLADTKGPEVRLCKFEGGKATLEKGAVFTLTADECMGNGSRAQITYKDLPRDLKSGDRVLLDDGLIELKVIEINGSDINCAVVNGGGISDNKGVNIPGVKLKMPYISPKDYADVEFAAKTGFDFVAASFCSNADEVLEIRELLGKANGEHMRIIAKIENQEGVNNINDILRVADGVMVARGDLGVEIPLQDVPVVQKYIINECLNAGKEVITATQMLESMIENPRPTRAEASDIANAIYEGSSAIMLSGETASGKYPLLALKTMATIAERTERDIDYEKRFPQLDLRHSANVTNAIAHATCSTAYTLGAAAIITVTSSGATTRMVSQYRPSMPIIGCSYNDMTYRQLALSWGVVPLIAKYQDSTDDLIDHAMDTSLKAGVVAHGDLVVVAAGMPSKISGATNLLKVDVIGDVLVTGKGIGASSVTAPLCVAKNHKEALLNFKKNDILVVPSTSNELLGMMKKASGIITETDGRNSHAAIVGLALDIPVIVGAENATKILKSGTIITLDADKGMAHSSSDTISKK